MKNLEKIINKYLKLEYNSDNYYLGGGLSDTGKKASNRHEDALNDKGKLTFGKAAQMFKNATNEELSVIYEIFDFAVPGPEWHHAGFLPKNYGGGMKKTYFLNASEIIYIAKNFDVLKVQLAEKKNELLKKIEIEKNKEENRKNFLRDFAHSFTRLTISELPKYYIETNREMEGKYGWFSAYGKSYNLTEYISGYFFDSEEKRNEYFNI